MSTQTLTDPHTKRQWIVPSEPYIHITPVEDEVVEETDEERQAMALALAAEED